MRIDVQSTDLTKDIHKRVAKKVKKDIECIRVVLPDGRSLAALYLADRLATIGQYVTMLPSGNKSIRLST